MPTLIEIKVNIIDGNSILLSISDAATVLQLMEAIEQNTGIRAEEQRIIYLGHVLDNEKKLTDYHIHDGVCLQLVKRRITSETNQSPEEDENETIRSSYVVYLPFRITETTTVPRGTSRTNRSSSTPLTSETPIEGEPPVQRYPNASLATPEPNPGLLELLQTLNPQADSHERLCNAVEKLLEQGSLLSDSNDPITIRSHPLHSTLHAMDKVIGSLLDYYHSKQNDDGVVESIEEPLVHSSINAIQAISTVLKNVYA